MRKAIKILKDGGVVGVYPEGKLMPKPGVHKFEKGAAFLARKTVVAFGEPFLIEAPSKDDDEKNTEQIRQKISELYYRHCAH